MNEREATIQELLHNSLAPRLAAATAQWLPGALAARLLVNEGESADLLEDAFITGLQQGDASICAQVGAALDTNKYTLLHILQAVNSESLVAALRRDLQQSGGLLAAQAPGLDALIVPSSSTQRMLADGGTIAQSQQIATQATQQLSQEMRTTAGGKISGSSQISGETFTGDIVHGDSIRVGDINNSHGIAIGRKAQSGSGQTGGNDEGKGEGDEGRGTM